ncbi:HD domain-containing phosphohydrolase [Defluviimonas salinarum]|uniref:LuxR C-terminal-related transcriptional regulator n=1 Tax=Defluviimonas salinarum TaxID=2992147 RepID=A0ABT3J6J8_9RHOB|nr:HD domain-containing phosphohydrolase [Defluviimonas salinarum]MCW3783314.1 LuxR C-terminal-related transcriptional regulator [Defluviimonas salinarum]
MSDPKLRRADFMMVLAYASDLATGQSRDFALRSCVLGMRLAELAGFDAELRRNVYHQALLRYVGCNADTHLLSAAFGDEIALRRDLAGRDLGDGAQVGQVFVNAFQRLFAHLEPEAQKRAIEAGLASAMQVSVPILNAHCEVAQRIGERLGLSEELRRNLGQIYERWDGHGLPRGLSGEEVMPAVRLITLAQDAIALAGAHGIEEMARIVASRADGPYEAPLAMLMSENAELMRGIDGSITRETVLALEPEPVAFLDEEACEAAFIAVADMIDMRMPFTHGHSRAVADLAGAAASHAGLPAADVRDARRAGLVHDIGELSVPVSVWIREAPMSAREADEARLHPYHGERALAALGNGGTGVAALVARHHECLDRSGYPRGVDGSDLSPMARILAAAEVFETARERRPQRPALDDEGAAAMVRSWVREGRLCPDGAEAVLSVAGQPSRRNIPARLAGMTPREIEVLRLIATGLTAKEAAEELGISPKTADNHIQSIYSKIGVTTRAGAALFAVENGLLMR